MSQDKKNLRIISLNAVGSAAALPAPPVVIGGVVPTNRKRHVYFLKAINPDIVSKNLSLFRDGAAGIVPLDVIRLPGAPAGGIGLGTVMIGKDIEMPIYILQTGESLGAQIPAAGASPTTVFMAFYDEEC